MSFKLIVLCKKVDHKIDLRPGEHVFGRNKLLYCSDRRISRDHGLLIVNKDSLVLKSLHKNPCFYKKKGSTEIEILKQNDSIALCTGDSFALLKDSTWFEVLHIPCDDTDVDAPKTEEGNHDISLNEGEKVAGEKENDDRIDSNGTNLDAGNHDISLNETEKITGEKENDDRIDSSGTTLDGENSNDQATENYHDETLISESTSSANETSNVLDGIPENRIDSSELSEQNQSKENRNNINPQLKRSNSTDGNAESKKIKLEPEVKQEQDVHVTGTPGSSNQAGGSNDGNAAAPPPGPARERCMYGASCYRKNPQHHAQFSHPRDPDWGPGVRGVCPYGASCMKTDPRHWRDHEHPPGKLPPQRPGMQVVQRHGNIFYINANTVNFYDDHFQVEDNSGDSADYEYEF